MVGAGVDGRRPAAVRRAQRPRHRGAAGRDARARAWTRSCWPARWWSTARGATPARSTASSRPRAAAGRPSTPVSSRTTVPCATGRWPGSWSRRTPCSTRAAATPRARSPRSTTRRRGCGRPAARAIGLRYHNVYGPGMPRDTPYSGVAAIFRSSLEHGPAAAGLRGRRADARLRARARRGPRQRARPRGGGRPTGRVVGGVQRLLGEPVPIRRVAEILAEARAVRSPR